MSFGGKSLPGEFIIRSDKKRKKLKQLSISGGTHEVEKSADNYLTMKQQNEDSISSLKD
jgi:hypothetical protein